MLSTIRCGWYIVIHLNFVAKTTEPEPHLRKMPVDIVVEHLGRVRGGRTMYRYLNIPRRNTFNRVFSSIVSWFCFVILQMSGSVALAHDSRGRGVRRLCIEAAKIVRGTGCHQFKPFFTFDGAFNLLA